MKLLIVGPGRAGGALALAANAVGHDISGLVARSPLKWDLPFAMVDGTWPSCDLVVIATRDSDIPQAAVLVESNLPAGAVVHMSGATSIKTLDQLAGQGWEVGSFHPLQTLPDPIAGAEALAGSWVAVTATGALRHRLASFADDLGMTDFDLADDAKPAYHAGASAASNFLIAGLVLADRLLTVAGVPLAAAGPLSAEALDNAFANGPLRALTGPIARGDWETVRAQLLAAREAGVERPFRLMVEATALAAGLELPEGFPA